MLVVSTASVILTYGQGFLNLNFESANNLPGNPGQYGVLVSTADALPNWSAYDGEADLSEIYYVSNSPISGSSSSVELESGSLALNGNTFSAALYSDGSISQTGTVPDNSESLEFEAEGPVPGGSLELEGLQVTLGGQSLSFSTISEDPDYTVYGANIQADMDGQEEALTFINSEDGAGVLIDDIQFSPSVAPEPGEMTLIGLGAVLLYISKRRKQSGAGNEDG